MTTILVTGAAGFIGSAFCRHVLRHNLADIVAIDKMTYAASPATLAELQQSSRFTFYKADICDAAVFGIMQARQPDAVIHLAAESHVDRSIDSAGAFLQTNIVGTYVMLEAARLYWLQLSPEKKATFRFHHVSTDEVYGALALNDPPFSESTPYAPNSPYAATKAGSDHLVRAWGQTYGMPVIISNCSNNYGPYQFPEKLIPTMIIKAFLGEKLPVYGDGKYVRDWLYVDDHAEALWTILTRGKPGEKYLVGGDGETSNLDIVHKICALLDVRKTAAMPRSSLIEFVTDRPGHDRRYAIDFSKTKQELGWQPRVSISEGLANTIDWYLTNQTWWEEIRAGTYAGERLGLHEQAPRGQS